MKKEFRNSTKKYKLNNEGELIFQRNIKEKDMKTGEIITKNLELKVPTIKELNEKLYEFHCQRFHCNYKEVQDQFKENNIGFYGINSIIEDYVSNCPICVQTSRTIHRMEPVKSINMIGPNIRYEFNLTYLNNDLADE